MRDVVMWNVVTLDGFFEGATKWDLSFHELVWGAELERFSIEQLNGADAVLYGRVTYEGMADYWSSAKGEVAGILNAMPKVVFSHTLERADWNNTRVVRDAVAEVERLKQEPGREILIFGSADLCASLMAHDLIDEFRLCVAPVLLGQGTPLFRADAAKKLQLVDTRALATGGVMVTYRRHRLGELAK
jgi:dihydrofolate reductase